MKRYSQYCMSSKVMKAIRFHRHGATENLRYFCLFFLKHTELFVRSPSCRVCSLSVIRFLGAFLPMPVCVTSTCIMLVDSVWQSNQWNCKIAHCLGGCVKNENFSLSVIRYCSKAWLGVHAYLYCSNYFRY